MSEVITVAMQKGGVGKTTTTINLAAALAEMNFSVLVVDLDSQGNLTEHAGFNPEKISPTIYNVFQDEIDGIEPDISASIYKTNEGFDLMPSQPEMSVIELSLINVMSRERVLAMILEPVQDKYDYIFLDCSPSLGLLVINALTASDKVLIPVQTEFLSARGASMVLKTIGTVKRGLNPDLAVSGIILTMADMRTIITRDIVNAIQDQMGGEYRVFQSIVRRSVRFAESAAAGQSIISYDPDGRGAAAYRSIAKELVNG